MPQWSTRVHASILLCAGGVGARMVRRCLTGCLAGWLRTCSLSSSSIAESSAGSIVGAGAPISDARAAAAQRKPPNPNPSRWPSAAAERAALRRGRAALRCANVVCGAVRPCTSRAAGRCTIVHRGISRRNLPAENSTGNFRRNLPPPETSAGNFRGRWGGGPTAADRRGRGLLSSGSSACRSASDGTRGSLAHGAAAQAQATTGCAALAMMRSIVR